MNGEVIKEYLIALGFQVDQASLAEFSAGVQRVTLTLAGIGAAAVGAAGMITSFVTSVAQRFDDLGDLGEMVNATPEEIMRLGYAAELTGSNAEALNTSLAQLNRAAGDAAIGLGRSAEIFQQLGISVSDSNGALKTSAQLLGEIGAAIRDMDRPQQVALLQRLGIDPSLIGLLTSDISELTSEFDQLYASLGVDANEAAAKSGDLMDSLFKLGFAFTTLKDAVAISFMGQIKDAIDSTRKFIIETAPRIFNAVRPIIDIILRVAEATILTASRIGQAVGKIIDWFMKINEATHGVAAYVLAAVAAWRLLNLSFLATPLGMVLSLAAAIALLVDDFLTWREHGVSLIDWSKWEPPITAAIDIVGMLGDAVVNAFGTIYDILLFLSKLITGDFKGAWDALGAVGESIVKQYEIVFDIFKRVGDIVKWLADLLSINLSAAWDSVVSATEKAKGAITSAFDSVKNFGGKAWDFIGGAAVQRTLNLEALVAPKAAPVQTVSQNTEIIVQGSSDPQATARAVAGQQNRVNADMARNLAGAVR